MYIYITIYIYTQYYIYIHAHFPKTRTHHSLGTWRPWEPRQTRRFTGRIRHGHGDLMVILLGIS